MLILNLNIEGDNLYARPVGKLTKSSSYKFYQYVIPYMKQKGIKKMICDCEELKKIDMDGKHALLKTKLVLKHQKGTLLLYNVKEEIKKELIGYRMRIQS